MDSESSKGLIFLLVWVFTANWVAYKCGYFSQSGKNQKPYISFGDVFSVFFIFLSVQLIIVPAGAYILNYYTTGGWKISPDFDQGWMGVFAVLISALGVLLFCFVLEPRTRGIISFGGGGKFKEDISWGAVAWLLCFPLISLVAQGVNAVLTYYNLSGEVDQVAVKYLKDALLNPKLFWTAFWLIIFVVPFIEETLFRGFFQTWLRQKMGPASAIALTSLLFAGFHFSSSQGWHNVDLLIALFVLSCYMGHLYEKRGSIWASASLHMLFNAISEMAIVLQEGGFPL